MERESWEEHVRASAERLGGPCVLDANDSNMHNFAQGSFELIRKDLEATLDCSADVAAVCSACEAVGITDAFAVRRELINYKKVMLHMMLNVQRTEQRLARLTTFYYRVHGADMKKQGSGEEYVHDPRYTTLANALHRCRGLLCAVRDGRDLAKSICCVPRQPLYSSASVARLTGLPGSLTIAKTAQSARNFLSSGAVDDGGGAEREMSPDDDAPNPPAISGDERPPEAMHRLSAGAVAAHVRLKSLVAGLGCKEHVGEFVRAVLVARGAAKALAVREELRLAGTAFAKSSYKSMRACACSYALK
jgi:hypothetical protein